MSWNYRVVKKKLTDEEESFDVCEVYYDKKGNPISYGKGKNVLSQDSYKDLVWSYNEIAKAYKLPVLEDIGDKLVEVKN